MKAEWQHSPIESRLSIGDALYAIVHPASRMNPTFYIVIYPREGGNLRAKYSTHAKACEVAQQVTLAHLREEVKALEALSNPTTKKEKKQ